MNMYKLALPIPTKIFFLSLSVLTLITAVNAQEKKGEPELTEFYTPVPPIVTPGKADAQPPSDALV